MTFKEKLQMDYPSIEIPKDCMGIGCPLKYEYEESKYCYSNRRDCEKCWNREMPDTEPNVVNVGELMDRTYEQGLLDAWALAQKLEFDEIDGGLYIDEVEKIFGCSVYDVFKCHSPQEALAKLKAYEEQRNIEVGDIVLIYGEEAVVTRVVDEHANILFGDGVTNNMPVKELVGDKTDKHIDIKSFLKQIGE